MKTAVKYSIKRRDAKHRNVKPLIHVVHSLQAIKTMQRLRKYRNETTLKLRQFFLPTSFLFFLLTVTDRLKFKIQSFIIFIRLNEFRAVQNA